jgi:beta-galactosidase
MGNAVGNLQDYWNEIHSNPRMLGGFIWEWCDQGLHKKLPDGKIFTAFGGDFGDVPNHGGFCIKGLVSAERAVFPKYWEVKKVYQPVAIEPVNLKPGKVAIKVTNRNSFLNLDEYEARWSATSSGGETLQTGILPLVNCAPGKSSKVKIPLDKILNPKPGEAFWLRVSFHTKTDSPWAKAGDEIAWQQLQLDVKAPPVSKPDVDGSPALKLSQSPDSVRIEGRDFVARFNRAAGTLTSLTYGGCEIIAQAKNFLGGPVLQVWRAPTDNDKGFGKWLARDWREAGLSNLVRHVDSFELRQPNSNEVQVTTVITGGATDGEIKLKTIWTIRSDGSVDMDARFQPFGKLPLLPRVGVVFCIEHFYDHLQWYGRGPWENYSDRNESADMGVWSGSVNEQYVPYVRPQENGNKEDVRWLALTDDKTASARERGGRGSGLRIETAGAPFSFSALHFTAEDLASARHNFELKPRPEIILSLDARMSGLGNSSAGPGVLEKYSVPPQSYRLHLRFSPATAGND